MSDSASSSTTSIPSAVEDQIGDMRGEFSRMTIIRNVSPFHTHHTPWWIYEAVDDALRREIGAGRMKRVDLDRFVCLPAQAADAPETDQQSKHPRDGGAANNRPPTDR